MTSSERSGLSIEEAEALTLVRNVRYNHGFFYTSEWIAAYSKGDVWGGGYVVVSYPREKNNMLRIVQFPRERFPALQNGCRVRVLRDDGK